MSKFYDKINKRLVYVNQAAGSDFWQAHWDKYNFDNIYSLQGSAFDFVINSTKKYLAKESSILEGGCGLGQQVYKLQKSGYKVIGVDFAEKTVEMVNKVIPELDIRTGDVTKLGFGDNYFDGYWSFGVIEHFYYGFRPILLEMKRVIKPGGYLFVTFPHMSFFRKIKAKFNSYPVWQNDEVAIKDFYQFALDYKIIQTEFENNGFIFIQKQHLNGLKGLKDEVQFLKSFLQKIFDSKNLFGRIIGKIISILFSRFSSHSILLIFKNT